MHIATITITPHLLHQGVFRDQRYTLSLELIIMATSVKACICSKDHGGNGAL